MNWKGPDSYIQILHMESWFVHIVIALKISLDPIWAWIEDVGLQWGRTDITKMNLCEVKAHSGVLLAKVGLLYVWLTAKSSWRRQRHWFDQSWNTHQTHSYWRGNMTKSFWVTQVTDRTHTKEPDGLKSTDTVTAHSREAWSWTPWRELQCYGHYM